MMGTKEDPGLTPRLCQGLFSRIEKRTNNEKSYRVSVSYLEIYNERVRDLLKPSSSTSGLRVREHPRLGPYVQGLTHHVVHNLGSLMSYVEEGTKARKTASTLQNPSSSRSHALLTIAVSSETSGVAVGAGSSSARRPRGGSKLRLVDLAGSESAATCSGVHRLKEGANINKSLVALGNVISALAERGSAGSGPGRRFIPYRDSSLTWLLKDALGGNATTIMLATISPASGSYNETAHTLRFAQRAQSVVNRPMVNEDPVARVIRELRAEVARLKLLLLEKNIESCSCRKEKPVALLEVLEDRRSTEETESTGAVRSTEQDVDAGSRENRTEAKTNEEGISRNLVPIRRSNSTESIVACEAGFSVKRFGSCEFLAPRDRFANNCNRARVTELNDAEDEIGEIHESVFVDIPTLVAVLIKPEDTSQESAAQIEEICSDEAAEDAIDVEFIESGNDRDDRSGSIDSCRAYGDNQAYVYRSSEFSRSKVDSKLVEKPKFGKQDSVDVLSPVISSNLHTSKKFGSVEIVRKQKEPLFPLERSQTNLEKRSVAPDKTKKLNNIREIEDRKNGQRNAWMGSKEQLERKGSNDSDKSLKEAVGQLGTKSKNYARKSSLENLKRKTSKDSSSSSSKDEQILISNLARDKLLHRKNSLEQEPSSIRTHTPIQRAKRSEIVAAVTERLYASKKAAEDASEIRSPPEATDAKSMAKMKLQEISRKMLGRRRRVCVDTQTEVLRTVRTKDTASLTETPQVTRQDVGVLTDEHEIHRPFDDRRKTPVLRVKEIATSTDKPKTNVVKCRDVACLANDLEDFDREIHSPPNDSGILSDDTQNYAESNLSSTEVSDLCQETDRRTTHAESSTNTFCSSSRSFAVQTPRRRSPENEAPICSRHCCNLVHQTRNRTSLDNTEKSVISISLPDTISITIESANVLESRIAVMDSLDQEKPGFDTKDGEVQTDDVRNDILCPGDPARSTLSQTDGRVFRIENIFQDPNNASKPSTKADVIVDRTEGTRTRTRTRNSITLRNSLGTCYASQPKENANPDSVARGPPDEAFIRDGLITEAFITKKRGFHFGRGPEAAVSWPAFLPANAKGLQVPAACQPRTREIPFTGATLSSANCASVPENVAASWQSRMDIDVIDTPGTSEGKCSSTIVAETSNNTEHDHSFSDDSLDYNESNAAGQSSRSSAKEELSREQRESLCPPDVVAHTKKDCPKSSSALDDEKNLESVHEAEDVRVELPRKKPEESTALARIHDYESLILGRPCYGYEDVNEESDAPSDRGNTAGKKKVSFSSPSVSEKRAVRTEEGSEQGSRTVLKSIIKKRKKRAAELSSTVQSSNDETDDSQQDEKTGFAAGNDRRDRISCHGVEETSDQEHGSMEFRERSKQNREKTEDPSEYTCSESESCENAKNDETVVPYDRATRNLLEEYLTEAAIFMRNLNSVNECANLAGMLDRYDTSVGHERCRKRGTRRKSCFSARNRAARKPTSKDNTEVPTKETDDLVVSAESYERCLKGIRRLEGCIRRVDEHNELLREKYGVDCESAGARPGLASPSTDSRALAASNDFTISRGRDVPLVDLSSDGSADRRNGEDDDLEKSIFDQLMNAVNSTRCRSSAESRNRFSELPAYSKFRENHDRPFRGDVRGSFDLDETRRSNEEQRDFTRYEITGNLSVARTDSAEGNVDDDLETAMEEDLFSRKRFGRTCWSVDATDTERKLHGVSSRTVGRDDPPNLFAERSSTIDSSEKSSSKTNFRIDHAREWFRELDDCSRKTRDSDSRVSAFSRDRSDVECSTSEIPCFREKPKLPGSPRARFLELLRERRRIVESSKGTTSVS
ncbi:uncharacterized protein LOC143145692 [Ptiloglossa arizonensis]|uniref:uncharacterized protein LOC143145692 n=1 Tax=Ptiloglossa arizonensis TaxID=3350558 RepID=UPI003F9F67F4